MSDLYTSLSHYKMELANGGPIPYTPVSPGVRAMLPFAPGLGVLNEDDRKGLQCPACGKFFHGLARHWSMQHSRTVCDLVSLRRVLEIKKGASLSSSLARMRRQLAGRGQPIRGIAAAPRPVSQGVRSVMAESRKAGRYSVSVRNQRNLCEAQMAKRYIALRDRLGRDPKQRDARLLDVALNNGARKFYGGWIPFVASIGGTVYGKRWKADTVLDALKVWFDAHGRLPTSAEVAGRDCVPFMPYHKTVLHFLGVKDWPTAMSHAAWLLGVECPRYSPKPMEKAA